jgi:hypothetical protein
METALQNSHTKAPSHEVNRGGVPDYWATEFRLWTGSQFLSSDGKRLVFGSLAAGKFSLTDALKLSLEFLKLYEETLVLVPVFPVSIEP